MQRIIRVGPLRLAGLLGLLGLLSLAGCGERPEDASRHDAADRDAVVENRLSDEAEVMRQAAENRKRFLGDGKAKYTPQPVQGF